MVRLTKSKSNFLIVIMVAVVMTISFLMMGFGVRADSTVTAGFSKEVYDKVKGDNKTYEKTGGGVVKAETLIGTTDEGTVKLYKINEATYSTLTSAEQSRFINDLNDYANAVVSANADKYSDETVTDWYQVLQQQEGVGSKMLNVILSQTKPDFVTANRIYKPFSGLVGTALGLGAVLIMAALGIVMVADIGYITLPPVRLFAGEEGDRKGVKSYIFSHDATYAVQQAENNDGGDGNAKQALGIYFKRRVIMLILLGICLLYLVSGQIFGVVGKILDLVSGFVG